MIFSKNKAFWKILKPKFLPKLNSGIRSKLHSLAPKVEFSPLRFFVKSHLANFKSKKQYFSSKWKLYVHFDVSAHFRTCNFPNVISRKIRVAKNPKFTNCALATLKWIVVVKCIFKNYQLFTCNEQKCLTCLRTLSTTRRLKCGSSPLISITTRPRISLKLRKSSGGMISWKSCKTNLWWVFSLW